jgi:hypothetical protein
MNKLITLNEYQAVRCEVMHRKLQVPIQDIGEKKGDAVIAPLIDRVNLLIHKCAHAIEAEHDVNVEDSETSAPLLFYLFYKLVVECGFSAMFYIDDGRKYIRIFTRTMLEYNTYEESYGKHGSRFCCFINRLAPEEYRLLRLVKLAQGLKLIDE